MTTAMDFLPSDLEHMNTNFLDMIENDANSQILDIDNLNADRLNDFLNGDILQEGNHSQMDFLDTDDLTNSNWFQNLQGYDSSKVPQSLIDASNGIENNNPNLLVNPQSVLPMHSTALQVQNTTQQLNQINSRNGGFAVKINGQDAVLTPTQHPQIQYVTVQNVATETVNNMQQLGYTVQPITLSQQQFHNIQTISSPSLTSPVLVEHLQNGIHLNAQHINNNNKVTAQQIQKKPEKVFPKPVYSYSCLIAMALKNSKTGNLPVSEIYSFMIGNFPYFKTAPDGWKNSVRHNLSLNKCFAKVETNKPPGSHTRKGCLWALNPAKVEKMEDEIVKWRKKDPDGVRTSMSRPENLELIEAGKSGPFVEIEEPVHVTQVTQVTPIKQEPIPLTRVNQVIQTRVSQPPAQRRFVVKQEVGVVVKTDPDMNITNIKEINQFDPALSDLACQTGLWDEELTIGIGNTNNQSTMCSSPLTSPTIQGHLGTQYHGNITYTTCSGNPLLSRSPMHNSTPTKLYPQTPTKIYPQTPTRIVLA